MEREEVECNNNSSHLSLTLPLLRSNKMSSKLVKFEFKQEICYLNLMINLYLEIMVNLACAPRAKTAIET